MKLGKYVNKKCKTKQNALTFICVTLFLKMVFCEGFSHKKWKYKRGIRINLKFIRVNTNLKIISEFKLMVFFSPSLSYAKSSLNIIIIHLDRGSRLFYFTPRNSFIWSSSAIAAIKLGRCINKN